VDYLAGPPDLVAWANHARLIDMPAGHGPQSPEIDRASGQALLATAKRLREAIYEACADIADGKPASSVALSTIGNFAAGALAAAQLTPASEGNFTLSFDPSTVEKAILGPVAISAMDLLRTGPLDRLKQCPGEDCGWLFLDGSKNGSRRWCDMATCGNRHKGHVHRAKNHK